MRHVPQSHTSILGDYGATDGATQRADRANMGPRDLWPCRPSNLSPKKHAVQATFYRQATGPLNRLDHASRFRP